MNRPATFPPVALPTRLKAGDLVIVQGVKATCRGDNPKVPGDYWIEFDGTGWWSFNPSDVAPLDEATSGRAR